MSGIAGVWQRDASHLDSVTIDAMLRRMGHRGVAQSSWLGDGIALGLVRRGNSDKGAIDRAGWAVVFDGRLDNRSELSAKLTDAGCRPVSDDDAELALCACRVWGSAAPAQLLGDFAFAAWSAADRTLWCARDARGIRPLCYRIDGQRIAFASELQALVQPPFDQPAPNEGFIAEHLVSILNSTDETLFAGVYRVPPASVLVVTPDSARVVEYWRLDPRRELRYRDNREYDEHYSDLLREAVSCRLRDASNAAILLSGGLDSSVVTGMAATIAAERGGTPALETLSLSYPGDPCDERSFIEDVASRWQLPSTILENSANDSYEDDVRTYRELPTYPSGASAAPLFTHARAKGIGLVLTGLGGDEWFTGHPAHYADHLRAGRLLQLARGIRDDIRTGLFYGWRMAAWNAVRPLLPDGLLAAARRATGHSPIPAWIRPEFAARVHLRDRLYAATTRFGFPTYAQNELFREAVAGFCPHAYEMFDRTTSQAGVAAAHPLDDRRLMEFGMALPEEQRWTRGFTKAIVRRACAGMLPPRVRSRPESSGYSTVYIDAMRRLNARERLAAPGSVFDGWIDRGVFLKHFDRRFGNPALNDWPIWMALSVRLWSDQLLENSDAETRRFTSSTAHGRVRAWGAGETAVQGAGAR